jgi:sigma-B regulation protein RsbU (phosphoserine phosphatase)
MSHLFYLPIILLGGALFALLYVQLRRRLRRVVRERDEIEVEEHRMFDFLHGLGEALQEDSSPGGMHRYIVDGVARVVGADAGVLYLLDRSADGEEELVPTYLTRSNAPLVALPESVVSKSETRRDQKNLRSYLRLATVRPGDGLIGKALRDHLPIHAPNLLRHASFDGAENSLQENLAVLVAPLIYGQKEVGVLAVSKKTGALEAGSKDGEKADAGGAAVAEDFSANDFDVFASIAEQSSFALGSAIIHAEANDKRRYEDELKTASEIQRILLPKDSPGLSDYRVAAFYQAARLVSGDYYDYVPIDDDHFGVAIGDVCGKGIPASLIMAMCRSVLRAEATETDSAAEVLYAVNRSIFPDIREDMFITMLYLILERGSNRLIMARGGHEPPLHYSAGNGQIEMYTPPGIAVGIDEGNVFDRVTKNITIEMKTGDMLLLYTDGVTEALDADGEEFGREALHQPLAEFAKDGAQAVVDGVYEKLQEHSRHQVQSDDITLIAIEKR